MNLSSYSHLVVLQKEKKKVYACHDIDLLVIVFVLVVESKTGTFQVVEERNKVKTMAGSLSSGKPQGIRAKLIPTKGPTK